jgi:hypothetical protein
MKTLDRICGALLAAGGILHGFGSYAAYHGQPMVLLWALSASFAILLLAALNLVRSGRPADRPLAWICFAGCLVWIIFAVWFGKLIGNVLDFRPLVQALVSAILAAFSLRTALRPVR